MVHADAEDLQAALAGQRVVERQQTRPRSSQGDDQSSNTAKPNWSSDQRALENRR